MSNKHFADVAFRLEEIRDDRIWRLRNRVNEVFCNGGMIVARLAPTLAADLLNQHPDTDEIRQFLELSTIPKRIPEVRPLVPVPDDVRFFRLGRYAFEGELIQILLSDGFYKKSTTDVVTARLLATEFVDSIVKTGGSSFDAYRIDGEWAEWDEGDDTGFFSYNVICRHMWLIAVYDTD